MYKSKICRLFIPIAQTPEIYIAFIMMKNRYRLKLSVVIITRNEKSGLIFLPIHILDAVNTEQAIPDELLKCLFASLSNRK